MSYPILLPNISDKVAELIDDERARQSEKWGHRQFAAMAPERILAVLTEEVGEVAKAILEGEGLREEVVHVAAVAVAWLEELARCR